jgi:hypothetical protein
MDSERLIRQNHLEVPKTKGVGRRTTNVSGNFDFSFREGSSIFLSSGKEFSCIILSLIWLKNRGRKEPGTPWDLSLDQVAGCKIQLFCRLVNLMFVKER